MRTKIRQILQIHENLQSLKISIIIHFVLKTLVLAQAILQYI